MHKIKLILLLILPLSVLGQDLGIIDTRTTKNPALNGTYRISTDGKNLFFRNFIGISEKVANTDSATFTGLITLPSTTSIGNVSAIELSYLDGVTSSIQTQLNSRQILNGTGFVKASGTTISYDNSTYLTTSDASSTYAPIANPIFIGVVKVNSGVNNIEIDQSQIMFRRTSGTTMTLGNYRAYGHYFFTGSTYAGLTQAMSINNYGQVNIGNQVLDEIVSPTTKFQVGDTGEVIQKIVSQNASAKLQLSGATGGYISNSIGNLNYTSVGSHIFDSKVILPDSTRIGNISSTELSYLDGVTSSIQTQLGNKQPQLNGTGFVKASGTTISYDNSTYLTTSTASSTYLPLAGGTVTGNLTLNNGAKFVGQVGTLYNGNQVYIDFVGTSYGRIQSYNAVGGLGMPLSLNGSGGNVGIGMTSPTEKLNVSGNILATGTVLGSNLSGTNTGDNATNTQYSGLATSKQDALSGTGFVKASGTTISYDNSTYLTTSTASSTYLPIANPTATGTLTAPTIANSLGANFATTSGNVGIGTTTPSELLHVNGSSNTTIVNESTNASGIVAYRLKNGVANNSWQIETGRSSPFNSLEFNNNGIKMTLTNGGNVGIGTTSPSSKLHLSGSGDNTLKISSTATNNPYLNLTLQNTGSTPIGVLEAGDGVAYRALALNPTSGNVMIGTSSNAGYKLDVNGTSRFTSKLIVNSSYNSGLSVTNGVSNGQIFNDGNFHVEAAEYLWINGNSTSPTQINAGGGNTYINSGGGRVGIGTTTPAATSILDITSTTQGVLFPRLTTTQINAITSPANGLTVYNTTLSALCFYDSAAAVWKKVSHSNM